jgi:hypothetical protein
MAEVINSSARTAPCTTNDTCVDGLCVSGESGCECTTDADCVGLEDGDCNGTLVCVGLTCVVDALTVVACSDRGHRVRNTCDRRPGSAPRRTATSATIRTQHRRRPVPERAVRGVVADCDDDNLYHRFAARLAASTTTTTFAFRRLGVQLRRSARRALRRAGCRSNDDNPCTDDTCDDVTGCRNRNAAACEDGDGCTQNDVSEDVSRRRQRLCLSGRRRLCGLHDGNSATAVWYAGTSSA